MADRAVSVSISIPLGHLAAVDRYAERKGWTRSAVLVDLIERAKLLDPSGLPSPVGARAAPVLPSKAHAENCKCPKCEGGR